jgi:tRNA A37 threonylcarbamoyltransferase TsaD
VLCFSLQKDETFVTIAGDTYSREDLCYSLQETVFAMLVEITGIVEKLMCIE